MFGSVRVEITFCLMGKDERVLVFVLGRHDEIWKEGSSCGDARDGTMIE